MNLMYQPLRIENHDDAQSQPAWVGEQISLFTAATGVKVRFGSLGATERPDVLSEICDVFRSGTGQCRTACHTLHQCQAETVRQSRRAVRLRCPLLLDHLLAPVSKELELYGFLYSEPVVLDGRPDGHGCGMDDSFQSGDGAREAPATARGRVVTYQRVLRVKSARGDGLLLLLELMGQRLGARFHQEKRLPVASSPAEALVRRAEAVLCSCYHDDVSTRDIADGLHVSESHLCHAFRKVTGGTLRESLNGLRFTEACRLLKEYSHLTVGEVAFAAGFQSLSRFSEQFRRRNMPSPGKWRQS
jgi:AraC-like DNA-binding protein